MKEKKFKNKDLYLKKWLIPKLRKYSVYWPPRRIAREEARVEIPDGLYKNGNPKIKVMYKCNLCKSIVERDLIHIDHIEPVVSLDGFKNWDTYIHSLYCNTDNLQAICEPCHSEKTQKENNERKQNKILTNKSKKAKVRK